MKADPNKVTDQGKLIKNWCNHDDNHKKDYDQCRKCDRILWGGQQDHNKKGW